MQLFTVIIVCANTHLILRLLVSFLGEAFNGSLILFCLVRWIDHRNESKRLCTNKLCPTRANSLSKSFFPDLYYCSTGHAQNVRSSRYFCITNRTGSLPHVTITFNCFETKYFWRTLKASSLLFTSPPAQHGRTSPRSTKKLFAGRNLCTIHFMTRKKRCVRYLLDWNEFEDILELNLHKKEGRKLHVGNVNYSTKNLIRYL